VKSDKKDLVTNEGMDIFFICIIVSTVFFIGGVVIIMLSKKLLCLSKFNELIQVIERSWKFLF